MTPRPPPCRAFMTSRKAPISSTIGQQAEQQAGPQRVGLRVGGDLDRRVGVVSSSTSSSAYSAGKVTLYSVSSRSLPWTTVVAVLDLGGRDLALGDRLAERGEVELFPLGRRLGATGCPKKRTAEPMRRYEQGGSGEAFHGAGQATGRRAAGTTEPGSAVPVLSRRGEGSGDRGAGGRAHGEDLQPRPRLLPGHRGDEARPRRVLPGRGAGHRQRPARAPVHDAPLPEGAERREGAPEAGAGRRPAVAGDGAGPLPPLRAPRRRAVRDRAGAGDLGRADVDRRVPPVELAAGRRREARRVADRPRPDARVPDGPGPHASPASSTRCSTSWARWAGRRRRAGEGLHVYVRIDARARLHRRAPGGARLRPRGRAAGAARRDHHLVAQGPGPDRAVRGLQPERPRPHDGGGLLGAGAARRHGVDADHVGRGRRRRARGLHDGHGPPRASPSWATSTPASTRRRSPSTSCSSWAARDEAAGAVDAGPPDDDEIEGSPRTRSAQTPSRYSQT